MPKVVGYGLFYSEVGCCGRPSLGVLVGFRTSISRVFAEFSLTKLMRTSVICIFLKNDGTGINLPSFKALALEFKKN